MIFAGKKFAREKEKSLKAQFDQLDRKGIRPKLVFVLVGENKEAEFYVGLKEKVAKRLGVDFTTEHFPQKVGLSKLYQCINSLNQDEKIGGITLEYPLPEKFRTVLPLMIAPEKDVDCLTPFNLGRLVMGDWLVLPSSVRAAVEVLGFALVGGRVAGRKFFGKNITIVGFGTLVGRPLSLVLKHLGATVTICDEFSKDLAYWTHQAEILISATGQPGLIKKGMVKKGAIILDLGYPKGDCDPRMAEVALFFTPVPGGIGPVTIACLFENLLDLYK